MGNRLGRKKVRVEEEYTRPQGIHHQPYNVDYKKLRRLIRSGKLAPCFPGQDEESPDLEECPICFYFFPSLNRSRCCTKSICTECFLQMKPQDATRPALCPFCKSVCYAVEYRGARTQEEKGLEIEEEQKVIEAKIRMQYEELELQKSKSQAPISSEMELFGEQVGNLEQPPVRGSLDPPDESLTETTESILSALRSHNQGEVSSDEEAMMLMEAIWLSVQVNTLMESTARSGLCSNIGSGGSVQTPNQAVPTLTHGTDGWVEISDTEEHTNGIATVNVSRIQSGDVPGSEQTLHENSVEAASELGDDEASSRSNSNSNVVDSAGSRPSDSEQCSKAATVSDGFLTEVRSMISWSLHSESGSDTSSSSSSFEEDRHCVVRHKLQCDDVFPLCNNQHSIKGNAIEDGNEANHLSSASDSETSSIFVETDRHVESDTKAVRDTGDTGSVSSCSLHCLPASEMIQKSQLV